MQAGSLDRKAVEEPSVTVWIDGVETPVSSFTVSREVSNDAPGSDAGGSGQRRRRR